MAGAAKVGRARLGIDRTQDGLGTVMGGDACSDTSAQGIDRLCKCGTEACRVLRAHRLQTKIIQTVWRHGKANESSTVLGHEVDCFGSDHFRRHGEVALILAVFIVDNHNHSSGANLLNGSLDIGKRRVFVHEMTSLSTQAEEAQKNRFRPAFYASSSVLMLAGMSSTALIQLSTNDNVVRGESVVVRVLSSD